MIIDRDLEPSAVRRDYRDGFDLGFEILQQLSHQTDGALRIVSNRAVFDVNPH